MSTKKITEGDMKQLRAVLQGKDGTAMWKVLARMKLSPKDKVSSYTGYRYIRKFIVPVLLGCGVILLFLIFF